MKKENNLNVNFKNLLNDKQELTKIFNHIGQDHFETEEILSTYEKNGNRHGVIFTAKETETGKMQKIIIDAIYGEPNSTQVKEVTYEIGAGCDKRVILYSLGHPGFKEREYEYDGEMAAGFAKINNDCGVKTYILKIPNNIIGADPLPLRFNSEVIPDGKRRTLHKKLPSIKEFEQAEFSIFYNYTSDWRNPHYIEHPEDWFDNYWHEIYHDISFRYPIWTENGLFMQGVSKSEIGDVTLKWLMDSKIELIKKFFDNREINISKLPSGRDLLKIKLWDKSFSYFTNASIKEKEKITEGIRRYDGILFEFWDDLFGREISDDKILKDLGYIPEHAFMDLDKEVSA